MTTRGPPTSRDAGLLRAFQGLGLSDLALAPPPRLKPPDNKAGANHAAHTAGAARLPMQTASVSYGLERLERALMTTRRPTADVSRDYGRGRPPDSGRGHDNYPKRAAPAPAMHEQDLPRPQQLLLPESENRRKGWSPPLASPLQVAPTVDGVLHTHVPAPTLEPAVQHPPSRLPSPGVPPSPHIRSVAERSLLSQLVSPCDAAVDPPSATRPSRTPGRDRTRRCRWAPNPVSSSIAEEGSMACGATDTSASASAAVVGAQDRVPAQTPPHVAAMYRALLNRRAAADSGR